MSDADAAVTHAYRVGEIEIVAVSDGDRTGPVAEGFVLNAPFAEVQRAYAAWGLPEGHSSTPFNPTLIRAGGTTVLVDTGVGAAAAEQPGATAGFLLRRLAAIGVEAEDIDLVVISHFHSDHVNGLVSPAGDLAFPNAEISVPENEWSFWTNDEERARAPAGRMRGLFENTERVFRPIADRVQTHTWDEEVVPGVTAIGTPGHSVGHTSYLVGSGEERVFLIQDVSNHPAVSLQHPGWHLAFDQDPVAAERTRRATLEWLADEGLQVQGFHFPFPGLARVERAGDGYRAVPLA